MDTFSEAQIELDVEGRKIISKGRGNGPVNALDKALRKDLGLYNEYLKDLILVDFAANTASKLLLMTVLLGQMI